MVNVSFSKIEYSVSKLYQCFIDNLVLSFQLSNMIFFSYCYRDEDECLQMFWG